MWCYVTFLWCGLWCDARRDWCVMQCGMWCNITIESCAICAAVMRSGAWCGMWCDEQNAKWCTKCVFVIWNGAMWNDVECVTMLLHHALPHHTTTWFCDMEWCMMWCGEWDMGCVTMLSHHHSSIIPHLTAQHSTLHHISSCNSTHHALPHRTTTYCTPCEMWCAVSCVLWYGMGMWNVVWCDVECVQCHHTMLCHSAPPHIAQHSRTFPHCTTPHLIAQHSTSLHVTQYRPCFATSHHHILHIMWCNEMWCYVSCDMEWCMKWSVVRCGMRCYTSHNCILQCVMCFCDMAHVECGVVQDVAQCGMGCGMFTMLLQHTLCLIAPLQNAHHSRIIPHITQHLYVTHYTPCNMCCCDVTRSGAWCGM